MLSVNSVEYLRLESKLVFYYFYLNIFFEWNIYLVEVDEALQTST